MYDGFEIIVYLIYQPGPIIVSSKRDYLNQYVLSLLFLNTHHFKYKHEYILSIFTEFYSESLFKTKINIFDQSVNFQLSLIFCILLKY